MLTAGMPTLTIRSCARAAEADTAISRVRWNKVSRMLFRLSIVYEKGVGLSA